MRSSLKPGVTETRTISVDSGRTVEFADPKAGKSHLVYATPALIKDIEIVCRDVILAHADAGEDSVGTRVDVLHLAPALPGQSVTITVDVNKVDGRTIGFEVSATDGLEELCKGRHERFVIDIGKTFARLDAKAEKIAGGGQDG